MTKTMSVIAAALGAALAAGAARAEPWTDYAPVKGVYVKTMIRVEPERMDDYLVDLKKTWLPREEILRTHGVIDAYSVQIAADPFGAGPNVALIEHYASRAALDPDKTRDQTLAKEIAKAAPKSAVSALLGDRDKLRTVIAQETWSEVDLAH